MNVVVSPADPPPLFYVGRCLPGALFHPTGVDRHPAVLPGARRRTADSQRQHRGVELHQPSAGGHWLCKLCGESDMGVVVVGGGGYCRYFRGMLYSGDQLIRSLRS